MSHQLKKYAEWLSDRGQVWPSRSPVSKLVMGPVTLFHSLARPQPEEQQLMAKIAQACGGQSIQIAFGPAAAAAASKKLKADSGRLVLAPEVSDLAIDPAAKKALWQEIQRQLV